MIGFYNYTVILTYASLLVSSVGICMAVSDRPYIALFCLLTSGVCDMFDGAIARTRKRTDEERRFGIQIDSLSDLVCFGVLPAVIGVTLAEGRVWRCVAWVTGAALILCGLIRLAYFNVTEETRQAATTERRTHYSGVPITTAAMVFPFAFGISLLLPAVVRPFVYPAFAAVTAISFICPFRVKKPHGIGLGIMGLIGLCEFAFLLVLMTQ